MVEEFIKVQQVKTHQEKVLLVLQLFLYEESECLKPTPLADSKVLSPPF